MSSNTSRICIVGAGMSGLLMAIKLKEAGIESFRIFEKADTVGGTWRENTYPGLTCDVPRSSIPTASSRIRIGLTASLPGTRSSRTSSAWPRSTIC